MPDNERNKRLAKWRGWIDYGHSWKAPDPYGFQDRPPAYDTDPAAALELLGWLAEKPREWSALIASNCGEAIVTVNLAQHLDGVVTPNNVHVEVPGPPLTALPKAIAEAAEAVREEGGADAR